MRRSIAVLPLIGLLWFVPTASFGEEEAWDPMWLAIKSVPALTVIAIDVEEPSRVAKKMGISKKELADIVELGLRRNGISIEDDPGFWTPRMAVEVGVLPIEATSGEVLAYIYRVDFVLWTAVHIKSMPRYGNQYVRTDLWRNGVTGYTSVSSNLSQIVRDQLSEFTQAFSLDFLRAESSHERELKRWIASLQ